MLRGVYDSLCLWLKSHDTQKEIVLSFGSRFIIIYYFASYGVSKLNGVKTRM